VIPAKTHVRSDHMALFYVKKDGHGAFAIGGDTCLKRFLTYLWFLSIDFASIINLLFHCKTEFCGMLFHHKIGHFYKNGEL